MTHYLSTIRYLTAAQIWHRGHRTIQKRWWRLTSKRAAHPGQAELAPHKPLYSGLAEVKNPGPWSDEIAVAIERARAASQGRFSFLRRDVAFGDQIDWHDPELSQLWRYQLHYFDYVGDLLIWAASSDEDDAYNVFQRLALSWIDNNQRLSGDGWHPYTISLRVVNWLHALSFFSKQAETDKETANLILKSAYGQVQILYSSLEFDVRGNHLLENLRALIWAGIAFKGPEASAWFEKGMRLLEKEVAEQISGDGGHFERSPGYHQVVFKDLLEIAVWLRRNNRSVPAWLDRAVRQMGDYLWQILAPDGHVPLLKDSTWDHWPRPLDLLAVSAVYLDKPESKYTGHYGLYAQLLFGLQGYEKFRSWPVNESPRTSVALPASGHYVIRSEKDSDQLILDAGKTCPDYLPAHAHADSLTYELTVAGQRIVVDSGVYEYKAGPWRDYFRSTRAHNTVEVAGENQSEVWSSFRVGRRAQPGPVDWQICDDEVVVRGEHDGYRRLTVPVVHQRTIVHGRERFWLVVDQLWGSGRTTASNHVHLNPKLSFEDLDGSTWRIEAAVVPLCLRAFGHNEYSITKGQTDPLRQGWYSEGFGDLHPNCVLTMSQAEMLPFCFGYVIALDTAPRVDVTAVEGGHELVLTFGEQERRLRLLRNAPPGLQ